MHKTWITLSIALLAIVPIGCRASRSAVDSPEQTSVLLPVHRFVNGFNRGDTNAAIAACTDSLSIIDEFPPHEWHGPGAMSKWLADYDADAKKNRITDGSVTLSEPRRVDITTDRAYVVVPADYAYKKDGKAVKETDSMLTIALQHGPNGWLITGWSWTRN